MIRNLFGGASKCRTIDKVDIFGDSSGVALYQLDGNANDTGGNYHGTETAITYGGGVYERGAVFNGTTSKVTLPTFTPSAVSLWFKVPETAQSQIGGLYEGRKTGCAGFGVVLYASNLYIYGATYVTVPFTTINTWTHMVIYYNGTNLLTYINGILVSSFATTQSTVVGNHAIGWSDVAYTLNGSIDQVRFFNRAITATEVATLYAECAPTSTVSTDSNVLNQAVAHYKLDGNALDSTGNYNGTETAMTYADGRFGQAGVFNGSTSKITSSAQVIPNGAMSVSLWWKNTGSVSYLAGNGVATADKGIAIYHVANGVAGFSIYKGVTAAALTLSTTNTFAGNTWHHMVITWDGTANANGAKVYVNGVFQVQGTSDTSSATIGAYSSFGIGGLNGGVYTTGSIDQIRFYNKALTATDVTALYNEALPTSTVDTVQPLGDTSVKAFYQFNGDATDATGVYNGTVGGTVTYGTGKFGQGITGFSLGGYVDLNVPSTKTISMWIAPLPISGDRWIMDNRAVGGTEYFRLNSVGNYDFAGGLTVKKNGVPLTSGTAYPTAGVFEHLSIELTTARNVVHIGNVNTNNDGNVSNKIDHIRIFNKALTSQEVQAIYSESSYAKTTLPTVELDPFLDNSCKALYKFDNNVLDAYGQYDGTATNVTYGTGKYGNAITVGGANYVTTNYNPASNLFSASVFVKINVNANTYLPIFGLGGGYTGLVVTISSPSNNRIGMWNTGGTEFNFITTGATNILSTTVYTHFVLVKDTATTFKLYMDGKLLGSVTPSITIDRLVIGQLATAQSGVGDFDQLRIFDKALTPLEVASLYNETTPLEEPMYKLVDPFKDGSGKALYRLEGNALDESGNYNGTATSVTYGTGQFGRCGVFNGSSSLISLPSTISTMMQTGNFTFSAWVRTSTDITTNRIIIQTNNNENVQLEINAGTFRIYLYNAGVYYLNSSAISANTWHHVVWTYNETSFLSNMYVNNVLQAQTLNINTSNNQTATTTLGSSRTGTEMFNGSIDQVRIFNRELTAGEVSALYTNENNTI